MESTVLSCEQGLASRFTSRDKACMAHTYRTEWLLDRSLFPLSNILMFLFHLFIVIIGYFSVFSLRLPRQGTPQTRKVSSHLHTREQNKSGKLSHVGKHLGKLGGFPKSIKFTNRPTITDTHGQRSSWAKLGMWKHMAYRIY